PYLDYKVLWDLCYSVNQQPQPPTYTPNNLGQQFIYNNGAYTPVTTDWSAYGGSQPPNGSYPDSCAYQSHPATYTGGGWTQNDNYFSKLHNAKFGVAICPSDPSPDKPGVVNNTRGGGTVSGSDWGTTNYLANWWVFNATIDQGFSCGSGNLFSMPDGASNTI